MSKQNINLQKIQTGISLPKPIMKELDSQKAIWGCDRSAAISRIFEEWKLYSRLLNQTETQEQVKTALS